MGAPSTQTPLECPPRTVTVWTFGYVLQKRKKKKLQT